MQSDPMTQLWEQLPEEIEEKHIIFTLEMRKYDDVTVICYRDFDGKILPEDAIEDQDPIVAMKNMLIYIRSRKKNSNYEMSNLF